MVSCFCAAVPRRPPLYVANHAVLREKRVIKRMVWHKDRRATAAGWTVDSVDADSHDNWAAYHVLKAHGQKLVDGDCLLTSRGATDRGLNKHHTVVSEERKKKSEEKKRKREEEGEEGEGEEYG